MAWPRIAAVGWGLREVPTHASYHNRRWDQAPRNTAEGDQNRKEASTFSLLRKTPSDNQSGCPTRQRTLTERQGICRRKAVNTSLPRRWDHLPRVSRSLIVVWEGRQIGDRNAKTLSIRRNQPALSSPDERHEKQGKLSEERGSSRRAVPRDRRDSDSDYAGPRQPLRNVDRLDSNVCLLAGCSALAQSLGYELPAREWLKLRNRSHSLVIAFDWLSGLVSPPFQSRRPWQIWAVAKQCGPLIVHLAKLRHGYA
ncbi:hypothetical protein CT0861_09645 [Colletotrichum tofieldiae]|uniref:Uncharacterized protein n=1 Tax=Colletotrichum tofieldiae TaxID=708197 RepID=A0A166SVN9_9PEZI|nr:hypothetical protein CT0861_09645 [Colletotrichum tofieldiae]